ncbi:MAG: hypothetical protein R3211_09800 [Balneolaceae bacterium]|nr:hypothetical protein [Balneolaceae bacterium]
MNNNYDDGFQLLKARDFSSIITDTFTYIRLNIKVLGKALLYFVIPLLILLSFFMYLYFQTIFDFMPVEGQDPELYAQEIDSGISSMFGTLSMTLIISLVAITALCVIIYNHMALTVERGHGNVEIAELWNRMKQDLWMVALLIISAGFATVLGALFFILPGIFIYVKLSILPAAYIHERRGFTDSFSRSWNLTEGHWWFTFGIIIVMNLLVSFISYALTIPIGIIFMFVSLSGVETDPGSIGMSISIIYGLMILVSYIFYVLPYASLGLHYYNLLERKEGTHLRQRIEELGSKPQSDTS